MHRVEVAGLDNSHPVIADKQALRTALRQAAPRRTTGGGGTQSSDGAAPQVPAATPALPGASDVPAVPSAPSTSKVPVPRLPAPSLPTSAPSLPGAPLTLDPGGLADGLGGVVETILPDPTKLLP
jgi:hypothetical protein